MGILIGGYEQNTGFVLLQHMIYDMLTFETPYQDKLSGTTTAIMAYSIKTVMEVGREMRACLPCALASHLAAPSKIPHYTPFLANSPKTRSHNSISPPIFIHQTIGLSPVRMPPLPRGEYPVRQYPGVFFPTFFSGWSCLADLWRRTCAN